MISSLRRILIVAVISFGLLFLIDFNNNNERANYISLTQLNVRSGPGTGYSELFILEKGEEVEYVDKKNSWYQIRKGEKIGYVNFKYLEKSTNIEDSNSTNSSDFWPFIVWIYIVIVALFIFYVARQLFLNFSYKYKLQTVSNIHRGTRSERNLIIELLRFGVKPEKIFHDLYIEKTKGRFSQIDVVVVTEVGVIVFEVKEYKGWIYGKGNQESWTQVLSYGKSKFRMYNPVMQNNRHIEELKNKLSKYSDIPYYSVIVFYGNCNLKNINFIPNNVFIAKSYRIGSVIKSILTDNAHYYYENIEDLSIVMSEAVTNGEAYDNRNRHIQNVKDMLGEHRLFD